MSAMRKSRKGESPTPIPQPVPFVKCLTYKCSCVRTDWKKILITYINIQRCSFDNHLYIFFLLSDVYYYMYVLLLVIKNLNSLKKEGGLALVWFSVYQSYVVIGTLQGNSRCLIFIPWSCTGWPVLAVCVRGR